MSFRRYGPTAGTVITRFQPLCPSGSLFLSARCFTAEGESVLEDKPDRIMQG